MKEKSMVDDEIFVYIPEKKEFMEITKGTGDNLSDEDMSEGYVNYINISTYSFTGDIDSPYNEEDGGMLLLKKDYTDRYDTNEQVIEDCIQYMYEEPEVVTIFTSVVPFIIIEPKEANSIKNITSTEEDASEKETKEIMKKYWNKDFFSIEMYPGELKCIHFWGYFYDNGEEAYEGEGKTSRNLEWCGFIIPLEQYLQWDEEDFDRYQGSCNTYIEDMAPEDAVYAMNHYYNEETPVELPLKNVTMETPCGDYVDV